jgi:hypothetical protein
MLTSRYNKNNLEIDSFQLISTAAQYVTSYTYCQWMKRKKQAIGYEHITTVPNHVLDKLVFQLQDWNPFAKCGLTTIFSSS